MKKLKEESQEFLEKKELIKIESEADDKKFKQKMELILAERENNRIYHERELERGRIKNAEQRKLMQEKDFLFNSKNR